MKKQNVNNKLAFNKVAVAELNETQLQNVEGGASTIIFPSFTITVITLLEV
ncbi:bacteriocin [Flavobacterium sp. GA093]|uniref:Bacteriocin n=1 Tax=Flavobacterium hydrocarbonoxydans TaxID=2683249 RepID=A0A6I4NW96_9FLAO|nr:class I lanthipeptide [Flavobacterium hydrocarbonoxydans]MWB95929.1 bacteriocin [Flavobacterium hydrocarbonoxydans]